ncbi:hypothetical protein D3C80_1772590 [compost metagenome]
MLAGVTFPVIRTVPTFPPPAVLLYVQRAAWDKLNSSSHNGLFLALFGTDPLVLKSLCRHHMAAFFFAEFLDSRAEREHV